MPNAVKQIENQLRANRLDSSPCFLDALNNALSLFDAQGAIHDSNKPAIIRKKLKDTEQACNGYLDALNSLPDTARHLIGSDYQAMLDSAEKARDAIAKAIDTAKEYPAKGKLSDQARLLLGAAVAQAFRGILNHRPTSTKEGPFESVLAIVLEAATGIAPSQVHELARRAISANVGQHENGMMVFNLNAKPSN